MRVDILVLLLILGKMLSFLFFTIENGVCCGFVIYGLCYVEVGSLCAHFVEFFFYHKWVLNFVKKLFLDLLKRPCDLYSFIC